MSRLLCIAALFGALGLIACGDSEDPAGGLDESGSPKEHVVAVVASMREAIREGNGEEACSYMTEEGQNRAVRVVTREEWGTAETCAEAVGAISQQFGNDERDLDAQNVVTVDEVALFKRGTEAEAYSDYRGAMILKLLDGEWRVDVPFFVD